MGNSLSSLSGAVSLLGLVGLAMASTASAEGETDLLQQLQQIYFQPDGSLSMLPILATVVAGLLVVYLVRVKLARPDARRPIVQT
jgi:hypothetical protein